jgi:N-acetylglucosamine-6-phosphate deacetylase
MSRKTASMLLKGANIVTPERIIERGGVLIEQGRIARIAEDADEMRARPDQVYDLQTLTLLPGFIDVHNHGAIGVDVNAAKSADLQRVSEFLAREGVTAWLPTLVPAPMADYARATQAIAELMRAQKAQEENDTHEDSNAAAHIGARALGVHYEGPFVNKAQCGALRPAYFRQFNTADDFDELPRVDTAGAIHLMTFAPEVTGGVELARELRKQNWIAAIGHTRADVETLDAARAAGARHLTHFMNAMSGLHHRTIGVVGWGLMRDDVTCDLIADGVHINPLALQLVLRVKTAERISLISDSVAPTGLGDGEFVMWDEKITVKNKRTQNARGSIAGSVITMRDAARLLQSLGVSIVAGARMSSSNPARLLGIERETGSITEGKRADLTALDEKGKVRLTIIGGRLAFRDHSLA